MLRMKIVVKELKVGVEIVATFGANRFGFLLPACERKLRGSFDSTQLAKF